MDLSVARTQDIALELVKRSKSGLVGSINAGYVALAILDSFRTTGISDAMGYAEDSEAFTGHVIDILADELIRRDPSHPLVDVRAVSEWMNLADNSANAPK
jgi:hypothetical protein